MSKDRKQIILQSLAKLLEERDATKVTTAVLAAESGVTEAALYRHFPSKRSIFLELFTFCDQTIFQKVGEIKKDSDIDLINNLSNINEEDNSSPKIFQIFNKYIVSTSKSSLIIINQNFQVCDGVHRLSILKKNNIDIINAIMI